MTGAVLSRWERRPEIPTVSRDLYLATRLRFGPILLLPVFIHYIFQCYANEARRESGNLIPEKLSCHSLRHSKAIHLLQAGVNLVYIRDILGHQSVKTTEIYARIDSKQKREVLEKAYTDVVAHELPAWSNNGNLLEWLKEFK